MSKIDILLEAERRGILPENKKAILQEARARGLVPGGEPATPTPSFGKAFLNAMPGPAVGQSGTDYWTSKDALIDNVPAFSALKLAGRLGEGWQQGTVAGINQLQGKNVDISDAVARGLDGQDISGNEQIKAVTGFDPDAAAGAGAKRLLGDRAGGVFMDFYNLPIGPLAMSTPGDAVELLNDPTNVFAVLKGVGALAKGGVRALKALAPAAPTLNSMVQGAKLPGLADDAVAATLPALDDLENLYAAYKQDPNQVGQLVARMMAKQMGEHQLPTLPPARFIADDVGGIAPLPHFPVDAPRAPQVGGSIPTPPSLPPGPNFSNIDPAMQVMVNPQGLKGSKLPPAMDPETFRLLFPKRAPAPGVINLPESMPQGFPQLPPASSLPEVQMPGKIPTGWSPPRQPTEIFNGKQAIVRPATEAPPVPTPDASPQGGGGFFGGFDQPETGLPLIPKTPEQIPGDYFRSFGPKFKAVEGVTGAGAYEEGTSKIMKNAKGLANKQLKVSTVLRKMGKPGNLAADMIDNTSKYAITELKGKWDTELSDVFDTYSDADWKQISQAIENPGELVPTNISEGAAKVKSVLDEIRGLSQENIQGFKGLEDYYPHRASKEFLKSLRNQPGRDAYQTWLRKKFPGLDADAYDEIVRTLNDTGDMAKVGEAVRRSLDKGEKTAAKFGNLVKKRYDLIPPEHIRYDKASFADYLERSAEEIARGKYLGENYQKLDALLPDIQNVADRDYMKGVVENMRRAGKPLTGTDQLLAQTRTLNAFLLNFVSSATNLLQRGNLVGVKGARLRDVAKAFASVYTKEGKAFAKRSGLTGDVSRTLQDKVGESRGMLSNLVDKHMKFIGMSKFEKGNRTAATNMGQIVAKRLFSNLKKDRTEKFFREALEELGINTEHALKRGYLTDEDLRSAAFEVTKASQGLYRQADVPKYWNDNQVMKTATHLGSAAHLQSGFIWNAAKQAISNPRYQAINTLLLLGYLEGSGRLVHAFRDILKGEKPSMLEGLPGSGMLYGPGIGLLADRFKSASGGPARLAQAFTGPTFGAGIDVAGNVAKDVADAGSNITGEGKPTVGDNLIKAARPIMSRIPFIGSTVTPGIFNMMKKKDGPAKPNSRNKSRSRKKRK